MKQEAIEKFGSIFQFGVSFMEGFNEDAETFLSTYRKYEQDIKQNGFNREWYNWQEENQNLIIRLHDALKAANKIPTSPQNTLN